MKVSLRKVQNNFSQFLNYIAHLACRDAKVKHREHQILTNGIWQFATAKQLPRFQSKVARRQL